MAKPASAMAENTRRKDGRMASVINAASLARIAGLGTAPTLTPLAAPARISLQPRYPAAVRS